VHGRVRLDKDAEALVLDPCFRGAGVERAAGGLGCPVEWHAGFRVGISEMRRHPDYRGPEFVELGSSLARNGYLNPRIIGDAARTGRYDDQAVKRVWHYVARYGSPDSMPSPGPPSSTPASAMIPTPQRLAIGPACRVAIGARMPEGLVP
jgi:Protein of unknown function (DUF3626)